jgi:hypothetical protein
MHPSCAPLAAQCARGDGRVARLWATGLQPCAHPIACFIVLCVRQCHRACAYLAVQPVLEAVLDPSTRWSPIWQGCVVWLGPQVGRITGRSAQFEADEVVLFIVCRRLVRVAVLRQLLDLQGSRVARRRTNALRVAGHADRGRYVGLSHLSVRRAGREQRIGLRSPVKTCLPKRPPRHRRQRRLGDGMGRGGPCGHGDSLARLTWQRRDDRQDATREKHHCCGYRCRREPAMSNAHAMCQSRRIGRVGRSESPACRRPVPWLPRTPPRSLSPLELGVVPRVRRGGVEATRRAGRSARPMWPPPARPAR